MKKSYKSKKIWIHLVKKRTKRKLRELIHKNRVRKHKLKLALFEKKLLRQNIPCVKAPDVLLLAPSKLDKKRKSEDTEHARFIKFKNELQRTADKVVASGKNKLMISFLNTYYLYADACILLIAIIDSIKQQYPQLRFLLQRPDRCLHNHRPSKDKHIKFNVDAVFCHIGLYKLLGYDYKTNVQQKNVQSWHYVFSDAADGDVTSPIFDQLEKMGLANLSELYGGVIEGIANAVEHAYNEQITTERVFPLRRWWMLVAELEEQLLLFICDLGHGIPKTLRFNKDPKLLDRIFTLVGNLGSTDCKDIKAATLIKKTRTQLSHRGKGGQDIRTFIEKTNGSAMRIYSNRGVYHYNNRNGKLIEKLYDDSLSIDGTLLYWIIPLNQEETL
ncbi:hypothetical protein DPV90_00045 [Aggregatibacter aphrophilus]|uniref:hypothetical protein n=1 Tax=Aggregatibacter kilianii TaxID=2025884 RepID=UPI000D6457F0|nr:hypothetical protein [Aggregatibacter kilianii]RDE87455.1 hypothetical protein DPV90_00045 [Aggregatibacter aphrophilus]